MNIQNRSESSAAGTTAALLVFKKALALILAEIAAGRPINPRARLLAEGGLGNWDGGVLDEALALIEQPSEVLRKSRSGQGDPSSKGPLMEIMKGSVSSLYYQGIAEAVMEADYQAADLEGDQKLLWGGVVDSMYFVLLRAAPDNRTVKSWCEKVAETNQTPYDYMVNDVSSVILKGAINGATAKEFLSFVCKSIGPEVAMDLASIVKEHVAIQPGEEEVLTGRLMLALMALICEGVVPSKPETLAPFLCETRDIETCAQDLKRTASVWIGPEGQVPGTRAQQILRDLLTRHNWNPDWRLEPVSDAFLTTLSEAPTAYPADVGVLRAEPKEEEIIETLQPRHALTHSGPLDDAVEAEKAEAQKEEATAKEGPSMDFLQMSERIAAKKIEIAVIGSNDCETIAFNDGLVAEIGATTGSKVTLAADGLPDGRASREIRDRSAKKAVKKPRRSAKAKKSPEVTVTDAAAELDGLCSAYSWKFSGLLPLRFSLYSSTLLTFYGEGSEAAEHLQEALSKEFSSTDAFVLTIDAEAAYKELTTNGASSGAHAAAMTQLGNLVRKNFDLQNGRKHMPVVIVFTGLDRILPAEDFARVYRHGRLIKNAGPVVLSDLRASEILAHARRQPLGCTSRACQQVVETLIPSLDRLLTALRPVTRNIEIIMTSVTAEDTGEVSSLLGSSLVFEALTEMLVPSFIAQSETGIDHFNGVLEEARKIEKAANKLCRMVMVSPGRRVINDLIPGQKMVARKFKKKRVASINETVFPLGLTSAVSNTSANDAFEALSKEMRDRIEHMERQVAVIEERRDVLRSRI